MQIELIAPASEDSAYLPRVGLGVLAALTPPEDEIIYSDDVVRPFSIERDLKPVDLVGISVDSKTARRSYDIADAYRRRGVKVVMGGIHPTACPEEAREHADAVVLSEAEDHPDVEKVYARASAIDPGISIATVYRTVRLFEEAGILDRHDFGDGRARYEPSPEAHHDHLIDVETGRVIEFVDPELEQLQKQIAEKLGFRLVDHRMELYGVSLSRKD